MRDPNEAITTNEAKAIHFLREAANNTTAAYACLRTARSYFAVTGRTATADASRDLIEDHVRAAAETLTSALRALGG